MQRTWLPFTNLTRCLLCARADPCAEICAGLSTKRSKPTVVKKCLELGLIRGRAELFVKRAAKKKRDDDEDDFVVNSDDGQFVSL